MTENIQNPENETIETQAPLNKEPDGVEQQGADDIKISPLKLSETIKKRKNEMSKQKTQENLPNYEETQVAGSIDDDDDYSESRAEESPVDKLKRKLMSEKNLSRRLTKRIKELENEQVQLHDIYNEALLKAKFEAIIGEEKTNQLFPVIDIKKFYTADGDLDFNRAVEFIKTFGGNLKSENVLNNKKTSGVKVVNPLGQKPKSTSEYTIDLEDIRRLEKKETDI